CGFSGCKPYARAIANGEANIDRCPPGGEAGVQKLARLLKIDAKPVDRNRGVAQPTALAVIDETRCIGCTLCIQACPVDAIIGAAKQMHTVLARNCTGCELCIPPCPVDCIDMRLNLKVAH
ncbi:MAG: RnfABCDGE type electron transport complex subunit B, partial [Pseudomonadota bacterium]|nr:RnfABCDGE type electron transport complex subunit B [Pseudomonadota bacterium]